MAQIQDFIIRDGVLRKYTGTGGDVVVPDEVQAIGDVFQGNSALTGIVLPDTIQALDEFAFANCVSLRHVRLPENADALPPMAFYNCKSLREIDWPESVQKIRQYCFFHCESLRQVNIPRVGIIDKAAFSGCRSLSAISFSPVLQRIGVRSFYECEGLSEVIIPQGVESIGEKAFAGCIKLKHVSIPKSVRRMGKSVFADCPALSVERLEWAEHTDEEKMDLLNRKDYPLCLDQNDDRPVYNEVCRRERVERGFCERDWANMTEFIPALLADMLQEFSELHYAAPEHMTHEQWDSILREMAQHFRNAAELSRTDLSDGILQSIIPQILEKPSLKGALESFPPEMTEAWRENRLSNLSKSYAIMNKLADQEMRAGFDMLKEYIWMLWD
ncbi:MAG: leucine-rich repeat domain-containing protein [Clostridia bacterium]|nr:leucine-rich repeat domain-containing protein [Clostridia bacterium]